MLEYYDINTKVLNIPYTYNERLKDIPLDTIKIIFNEPLTQWSVSLFDEEIQENVLPISLTHLIFSYCYNKEIKENILPKSLTHLTFGFSYKKEIKENILPKSLTHLIFGFEFNKEIKENILPSSLTHLILGGAFNQKISIPKSLIELGFFGNSSIKDNIPDFVENIIVYFYSNDKYNKKITNLPTSIKKIKLKNMSNIHLIEKIPFGCIIEEYKYIHFYNEYYIDN
jgi:hypothetical protein